MFYLYKPAPASVNHGQLLLHGLLGLVLDKEVGHSDDSQMGRDLPRTKGSYVPCFIQIYGFFLRQLEIGIHGIQIPAMPG